jgi:enoyl-CoA hydratase/carnithine racemase
MNDLPLKRFSLQISDGIAKVTFDRRDDLNTVDVQSRVEWDEIFNETDRNDAVKAVIVTGAGRVFCAGADLSQGVAAFDPSHNVSSDAGAEERDAGGMMCLRVFESLKPVIAAVNGPAIGIGATILLPMDARIGSANSSFGFVFTRRGIVPDGAASWFLPRIVGISTALKWSYSGRRISADEALQRGLLDSIVPPEELFEAALRCARELVDNSAPVSIALTRQLLWRMLGANHPMEAHEVETSLIRARSRSADAHEGLAAFFEKRPPRFSDRVSADLPKTFPWWAARVFKKRD